MSKQNRMKQSNMLRTALLITLVMTLGLPAAIYASGTYRPPAAPKGSKFNKESLKKGKLLFESRSLIGAKGKPCVSCHTKKGDHPLRRGVLKKKGEKLFRAVAKCVSAKDRSAGKELESGTKMAFEIGAYIVARYRLPVKQLNAFLSKAAKKKSLTKKKAKE